MKVIVLTGLPLSGKSVLARHVSKKWGIPYYETGPFVFKEVEESGLEITGANIKKITDDRKAIADYYFTQKAVEAMLSENPNKDLFLLSGIRAMSEVEFLRERFGRDNVLLLGVHASLKTRYERIFNKDRSGATEGVDSSKSAEDKRLQDFDEFMARNKKELSFGVGSVMSLSDFLINNDDKTWPYHNVEHNLRVMEIIVQSIKS